MIETIEIKAMSSNNWDEVAKIYQEGIQTGLATFETDIPSLKKWNKSHVKLCRLVAVADNEIVGWAALSPVSSRCVYGGIAEVSVYVSAQHRRKNIGKMLLKKLIIESEKYNFWTLQSGVFPENIGSIKLHENLGFRQIGFREKIGKLNGVWKDTILFERRSKFIGIL